MDKRYKGDQGMVGDEKGFMLLCRAQQSTLTRTLRTKNFSLVIKEAHSLYCLALTQNWAHRYVKAFF